MLLWVWLIIAAVVLGLGTLLGLMDRRGRRQGHVIRRPSEVSAMESASRRNIRRTRPRVSPVARDFPKL